MKREREEGRVRKGMEMRERGKYKKEKCEKRDRENVRKGREGVYVERGIVPEKEVKRGKV